MRLISRKGLTTDWEAPSPRQRTIVGLAYLALSVLLLAVTSRTFPLLGIPAPRP